LILRITTHFQSCLQDKETIMTRMITNINRPDFDSFFVGFDRLFDQLNAFDPSKKPANYPPYNIIETGENTYTIEIALAGFTEEQIEITHLPEKSSLVVSGSNETEDNNYLHQGIASRKFHRTWTVADTIEVKGAVFANGILQIQLENVVPEEKKPKQIKITSK